MSSAPDTSQVDEIRRQMAQIRRELHEDVRDVVASAGAAFDWRRVITAYPWVSLGAAAAAGYLVVPKRHRAPATHADLKEVREEVESTRAALADVARANGVETSAERPKRKGLFRTAVAMIAPVALRSAQSYAAGWLENYIAQQQAQAAAAGAFSFPGSPRPGGGPAAQGPSRSGPVAG